MKKELLIGKKNNHQVYLDIEIKTKNANDKLDIYLNHVMDYYKTLSITTHSKHWTGQSIDEVKSLDEYYITKEQLDKLIEYWETYHLNDMRAYCIHQKQWDRYKKVNIVKVETDTYKIKDDKIRRIISLLNVNNSELINKIKELKKYSHNYYMLVQMVLNIKEAQLKGIVYQPKTDAERSWFDNGVIKIKTETKSVNWLREDEHIEGILNKKCNECGYEYGTKWLLEYLPDEVEEFFNQLNISIESDDFIQLHEIDQWLFNNDIECTDIVTTQDNPNMQSDIQMDHWLVTFKHNDKEFSFKYSTGLGFRVDDKLIKPLARNVFDALMNEINTYYELDDFENLADEFGYTTQQAKVIFHGLKKNEFKMRKLIGEDLIQQYINDIL